VISIAILKHNGRTKSTAKTVAAAAPANDEGEEKEEEEELPDAPSCLDVAAPAVCVVPSCPAALQLVVGGAKDKDKEEEPPTPVPPISLGLALRLTALALAHRLAALRQGMCRRVARVRRSMLTAMRTTEEKATTAEK